jgi:TatD DNase family protein
MDSAGIASQRVFADSHAHLSLVEARLGGEIVSALLSAYSSAWAASAGNVGAAPFMVDVGIRPGDLASRVDRFGSYPFVRFSAGLWPGKESLEKPRETLEALGKDVGSARCCALGECGLDYHHMEAPRSEQIGLFEAQVALAVDRGLPLIVHSREAFEDTLAVVSDAASRVPVIIHCFGYGEAQAASFLEKGCMLSFAGNITYKKSEELQRALQATPTDRLLMETDSPYMNPMPYRGKPGTSLDIARTIEYAARLKGMTVENLASAAQANAFRIFSGTRVQIATEPS